MFCRNCGRAMGDFDTICPNCGASSANASGYSQASYEEQGREPIKTTGLLVWSIIEILCVNLITGIIGLILWLTKLKPAADRGDVVEAKKAKKTIKIVLWIGLIVIPFILLIITLIAVPNYSRISDSSMIRADKVTAGNIGHATRILITELQSEGRSIEEIKGNFMRYDEVEGLDAFISDGFVPTTYKVDGKYEDGAFYVSVEDGRVIVAIGPEDLAEASFDDETFKETFYEDLDNLTLDTYDGDGSGIVWIEGQAMSY